MKWSQWLRWPPEIEAQMRQRGAWKCVMFGLGISAYSIWQTAIGSPMPWPGWVMGLVFTGVGAEWLRRLSKQKSKDRAPDSPSK